MNYWNPFFKSLLVKDWYINFPKLDGTYIICPNSVKNWLLEGSNKNLKDKLLKSEKLTIKKGSDGLDYKLFQGFDILTPGDTWNLFIPDNLEEILKNKYNYILFPKMV